MIETSQWEYLRGNECWCLVNSQRYSTLILTDGSPCSLLLWVSEGKGGFRWKRICRWPRCGATTCSMTFPFDDCNKWGPPPPPYSLPRALPNHFTTDSHSPFRIQQVAKSFSAGSRSVGKKSEFSSATWLGRSSIDSSKRDKNSLRRHMTRAKHGYSKRDH